MLVFLAPDTARLDELRQAARQWLAWESIDRDKNTLNLDNFQVRQVEAKAKESDETVSHRIAETYQWVLNPTQPADEPTGPIRWDAIRVSGSDSVAERVSKKLVSEESLIPAYSGTRLRLDIDRVPLWRGEHVEINQLWDDFAQYLYLPRLTKRSVLDDAIRDGVAALTWESEGFAYADSYDGVRYAGLRISQQLASVAPSGLLVKPAVATEQRKLEQPTDFGNEPDARSPSGESGDDEGGSTPDTDGADPKLPTRYYGRITLDSMRWTKTVADIADAVVNQLARGDGTKLSITIEVEAEAEAGFVDGVQRTVTENASTLKFDSSEFES
jgi:hypothetical protein